MISICLKPDEGRPCLVVGGGAVARRKVRWLLEGGARVVALAAAFDGELEALARARPGEVELRRAEYAPGGDLSPYQLVIAATDREDVNAAVAGDARRAGVPVNVVDRPALCDFYVPATLRRGPLTAAVSTSGECPSLAARIRAELEGWYPEWYGAYVAALGRVRRELLAREASPAVREAALRRLSSREVAERLRGLEGARLEEALQAELRP